MRQWKRSIACISAVAVFVAIPALAAAVAEPVFDAPEYGAAGVGVLPVIRGQAEAGMVIDIHVDGKNAGRATVTQGTGGMAQFNFIPLEPLAPGYHSLEAFASEPAGMKSSRQSLWWFIQVADAFPAPVMYSAQMSGAQLMVRGVVRSGSRVRIYVDGIARATSPILVHASGASGFIMSVKGLSAGSHKVSAAALRDNGQESFRSALLAVDVSTPVAVKPDAAPAKTQGNQSQSSVLGESASEAATTTAPSIASPVTPPVSPPPTLSKPGAPPASPRSSASPAASTPPSQEKSATSSAEADNEIRTTAEAPESVPASTAGARRTNARVPLLIVLGIILVALIIWYATRADDSAGGVNKPGSGSAPLGGSPRSSPPPVSAQKPNVTASSAPPSPPPSGVSVSDVAFTAPPPSSQSVSSAPTKISFTPPPSSGPMP